MFAENPPRAVSLKLACGWTLLLQAIGAYLAVVGVGMHIYLYWLSLVLGWVLLFVVDIRRRSKPTRLDICILFLSYPIIFLAMFAFGRFYLR
jgi:asparagine N-glycosylation enzyme membrane subunit Stt3